MGIKKETCSVLGCSLSISSNNRCWKHQTSSLPDKPEPVKKKVQIRKRSKKRMSGVSQIDIFHEIWDERPHKSEISGQDLDWICEGTDLWRSCFAHLLPKGKYPQYRNNKANILLLEPIEHSLIDMGTQDQRDEYFKEKLAEGVFVDWSRFYSLQEQLKKKYPN